MKRHTYYPTVFPTVTPLRVKAMRALRWLALAAAIALLALSAAAVIVRLHLTDAQLENVFMQGMTAGAQLCPRGV